MGWSEPIISGIIEQSRVGIIHRVLKNELGAKFKKGQTRMLVTMEKKLHKKMEFAWERMKLLKDSLTFETSDLECSFGNYVKIENDITYFCLSSGVPCLLLDLNALSHQEYTGQYVPVRV